MLIKELKKGEESGFIKNFDFGKFLKHLHKKYGVDQPGTGNLKPGTTS